MESESHLDLFDDLPGEDSTDFLQETHTEYSNLSYELLNYKEYSNEELINLLVKTKNHCNTLEIANDSLNKSVTTLEKALQEQSEKCKLLEEDKSFLRKNIKRASTSWFERKSKLSESDNESNLSEMYHKESNIPPDQSSPTDTSCNNKFEPLNGSESCSCVDLKFKHEELTLSNRRCEKLLKRIQHYEGVINDQEIIIHGLEKQLDNYFNDNNTMSKQLAALHKVFIELENINEKQVKVPESQETPQPSSDGLPTEEDFKGMSGSIAKTYLKLKELIYEKKSLVTEIERLRTLNVELQNRVSTQETKLIRVSDALQTTWLLVSNLKDEHEKIHTNETILRYELKEKREILRRLKEELECSREQWQIIRQKNSETEQEWSNLRDEINERRRLRKFAEVNGNLSSFSSLEFEEPSKSKKDSETSFEPPIDLLLDMGIEHGVVNSEDDETITGIALTSGEDVHEERLNDLEEQCCFLYQKLMTSTARTLNLASRLSSLDEHYSLSEEEDEDENIEDEDEYLDEDFEGELNMYESEILSPDSESYDTAYVSETDGTESAIGVPDSNLELETLEENGLTEIPSEEEISEFADDNEDVLSRRLITFLPRKIEILKSDIAKLEEKVISQQDEKVKLEATLTEAVECERRQKKQLEDQLSHLGKCVDELKLERNGKIAEVEEQLKKKVEEVEKEEKKHEELKEEFEKLSEKFSEREALLQLTSTNLEEIEGRYETKMQQLKEEIKKLEGEICDIRLRSLSMSNQSSQTDFQIERNCESQNLNC